jgi:hypothetical protein
MASSEKFKAQGSPGPFATLKVGSQQVDDRDKAGADPGICASLAGGFSMAQPVSASSFDARPFADAIGQENQVGQCVRLRGHVGHSR